MLRKYSVCIVCLIGLSLSACTPSSPIPDPGPAITETQGPMLAATPYPTYTPFPTYTAYPPSPYPTKIQFQESFSIRLFPGEEASLVYASQTGTEFWFDFPKKATSQPARVKLIPGLASSYSPTLIFSGDAFLILAGLGDQMEGFKQFSFNAPISVSIKFAAISRPLEQLGLYTWTGSDWKSVESVCNLPLPSLDTNANSIKTSICAPGAFAVFSPSGK